MTLRTLKDTIEGEGFKGEGYQLQQESTETRWQFVGFPTHEGLINLWKDTNGNDIEVYFRGIDSENWLYFESKTAGIWFEYRIKKTE